MSKTVSPHSPVSEEQLVEIAKLARVGFEPAERADITRQFASVLNYVDMLNSVDTTGVEPLYSPSEHASPVRPDEARATISREELFANAPESDGAFFIVPKIV